MLDTLSNALLQVGQPATILFLLLGMACGLLIGLLPGLGGTAAVALLMPFVFGLHLPVEQGVPLLVGSVAVVHHSDMITAVLLGIPGSASAAAVTPDGHAMARQGKAAHALSLAFLCQMLGGVLGAVGLTLVIPIARPLILSFGPPEIFLLSVLGIALTSSLLREGLFAGLVAATMGVVVGFVGVAPAVPVYRFTFGFDGLDRGISLGLLALGIFGIAEVMELLSTRESVATQRGVQHQWRDGAVDFLRHWKLAIRGSVVGIVTGLIPAVGGTAGAYIAYGQTVATAKDKSRFGRGDPRGLVGPEAASNAVESGSLIPTFLFGIPGSTPGALILGAMLFYGLEPGPSLISQHLSTVFVVVWVMVIASVLGSLVCYPLSRPLSVVTTVSLRGLAPWLIAIMFMGAYQGTQSFSDLAILVALGIVGYLMKKSGLPRSAFLIGFVLSQPLERYYFLTTKLYGANEWLARPYVIAMLCLLAAPIALKVYRWLRRKRSAAAPLESATNAPKAGAGASEPPEELFGPRWSVGVGGLFVAAFALSLTVGAGYAPDARLAPQLVGALGLASAVVWTVLQARAVIADGGGGLMEQGHRVELKRATWVLLSLVLLLPLIYVLGFGVAVAIYVFIFLWRGARLRIWTSCIHVGLLMLVFVLLQQYASLGFPSGLLLPAFPLLGS